MSENLDQLRTAVTVAKHNEKVSWHRWKEAEARAEAAEAAVQRVREVMSDWDTDEDAKGLHFDLERALDGGEQE